jgi:hypothetical protein
VKELVPFKDGGTSFIIITSNNNLHWIFNFYYINTELKYVILSDVYRELDCMLINFNLNLMMFNVNTRYIKGGNPKLMHSEPHGV